VVSGSLPRLVSSDEMPFQREITRHWSDKGGGGVDFQRRGSRYPRSQTCKVESEQSWCEGRNYLRSSTCVRQQCGIFYGWDVANGKWWGGGRLTHRVGAPVGGATEWAHQHLWALLCAPPDLRRAHPFGCLAPPRLLASGHHPPAHPRARAALLCTSICLHLTGAGAPTR
jgi:hypothetical protein